MYMLLDKIFYFLYIFAQVKKDTKAAVATGNKVIKNSDEANAAKTAGPSAEEGTGKTAEAAAAAAPKPHPVMAMKQKLQQHATKICNILQTLFSCFFGIFFILLLLFFFVTSCKMYNLSYIMKSN